MAKQLCFNLNGSTFKVEPTRLDRKKLYGWSRKAIFDSENRECLPATIDEASSVIIPRGDLGLGILSESGEWVDRSDLHAVDENGRPLDQIPSSFDVVIDLFRTVSVEEYLNHAIGTAYQLTGECAAELAAALQAAGDKIYICPFNYRPGYEATPAFLIESEGSLFLTAGQRVNFDYKYRGNAWVAPLEEAEEEEAEEELDFTF